jgi:DnaJ homologue, subfamily C, member 28, conserved domain
MTTATLEFTARTDRAAAYTPARSPNRDARQTVTMTERKPPGLGWERWIDRQIREATERGEFDDLPGAGKPIPDLDKPFDEMWWVKRKLQSEGLTYRPPSLALRKDAQDALEAASRARSEAEVQQIIENINERIREANRKGIAGPPIMLRPFNIERVLKEWREQRQQDGRRADPERRP